MLILFENALGFAIFHLKDDKKLEKVDKLAKYFDDPNKTKKIIELKDFEKFNDTTEAVNCVNALCDGKINKKIKKLLKRTFEEEGDELLAVADAKLATTIKKKLNISCVSNSAVVELMSCIRSKIDTLIPEWSIEEAEAMQLGVSHGLSRYRLKFSPDKVDTMIVQAVSLLDNLDKELNNYVMRCKEWYGWHFPELAKIIPDNTSYIKTVLKMGSQFTLCGGVISNIYSLSLGMRTNAISTDFSEILNEETENELKSIAEVSIGTDITEEDMMNIHHLCKNVLEMQEYRSQLFEYLKGRMMTIAPNLTVLVGELVAARLITHAGSLLNLAKHPASTVQILGAEKALFRALKTKHDTPKYGLIYHCPLIGQSNLRLKGKMSRMLAAKSALACRVDALGESPNNELGIEHKSRLEARLKSLEENKFRKISGTSKAQAKWDKYEHKSKVIAME